MSWRARIPPPFHKSSAHNQDFPLQSGGQTGPGERPETASCDSIEVNLFLRVDQTETAESANSEP